MMDFSDSDSGDEFGPMTMEIPSNNKKNDDNEDELKAIEVPGGFVATAKIRVNPRVESGPQPENVTEHVRDMKTSHPAQSQPAVFRDAAHSMQLAVQTATTTKGFDRFFAAAYLENNSRHSLAFVISNIQELVVFPTVRIVIRDARLAIQDITIRNLLARVPAEWVNMNHTKSPLAAVRDLFSSLSADVFGTRTGYIFVVSTATDSDHEHQGIRQFSKVTADISEPVNLAWQKNVKVIRGHSSEKRTGLAKTAAAISTHLTTCNWISGEREKTHLRKVLEDLFVLTNPTDSLEAISANPYLTADFTMTVTAEKAEQDEHQPTVPAPETNINEILAKLGRNKTETIIQGISEGPDILFYRCPSCMRVCWVFETDGIVRLRDKNGFKWLGCAIAWCRIAGTPPHSLRVFHEVMLSGRASANQGSVAMYPVRMKKSRMPTDPSTHPQDAHRAITSNWVMSEFHNISGVRTLFDSVRIKNMWRANGIVKDPSERNAFNVSWFIKKEPRVASDNTLANASSSAFDRWGLVALSGGELERETVRTQVATSWFAEDDMKLAVHKSGASRIHELEFASRSAWWKQTLRNHANLTNVLKFARLWVESAQYDDTRTINVPAGFSDELEATLLRADTENISSVAPEADAVRSNVKKTPKQIMRNLLLISFPDTVENYERYF